MSDAVRVALRLTSEEDTLVIVTADHSHVMTMGGYPSINNDIAGRHVVVVTMALVYVALL